MKKIILALMAASSLGAAVPAAAQPVHYYPYNPFSAREAADASRISWCVRSGGMSVWEARRFYSELRAIRALGGGYNPRMRFYIARRLSRLEAEIRATCHHIRVPYRAYEEESRFPIPHPDPGPYRGHDRYDRFDRYDRGEHRVHGGRFDDHRGEREILRAR